MLMGISLAFFIGNFLFYKYLLCLIREFLIIYRKILFHALNFLVEIEIMTKAILLQFVSACFVIFTLNFEPFNLKRINFLELLSNIAIWISLFAGAIFAEDNSGVFLRVLVFILIILINLLFIICCTLLYFNSIFNLYYKYFEKYAPNLTKKIKMFQLMIYSLLIKKVKPKKIKRIKKMNFKKKN